MTNAAADCNDTFLSQFTGTQCILSSTNEMQTIFHPSFFVTQLLLLLLLLLLL